MTIFDAIIEQLKSFFLDKGTKLHEYRRQKYLTVCMRVADLNGTGWEFQPRIRGEGGKDMDTYLVEYGI